MQGVRFLCMCLFGVLARVRGEFPARSAGDAGMVPLTSRETAKAENRRHNSLRSDKCRRFSNAATRELRGSQIPGSKHAIPEPHRCGMAGGREEV